MTKNNEIGVPESRQVLEQLRDRIMKEKGYNTNNPEEVKFEIANELGIPLTKDYNGHLTSEQVGKIGGEIGGSMVKEMVKLAQEQLERQ